MSASTTYAAPTFGMLIGEARTLLQDVTPMSDGSLRYSNAQMFEAINGAMWEARAKRPDLFLQPWTASFSPGSMLGASYMPFYNATNDMNTPFPLPPILYPAFVYYVVGRCELREDTFSEDSRAVTMMNKFTSQLLTVQS